MSIRTYPHTEEAQKMVVEKIETIDEDGTTEMTVGMEEHLARHCAIDSTTVTIEGEVG